MAMTMATATTSTSRSRLIVASTSCSDSPTRLMDPSGARAASIRNRPWPPRLPTVNGRWVRTPRTASATVKAGVPATLAPTVGRNADRHGAVPDLGAVELGRPGGERDLPAAGPTPAAASTRSTRLLSVVRAMITAAATSTNDTTTMPASETGTQRHRVLPSPASVYPNPRTVWMRRGSTRSIFLRR